MMALARLFADLRGRSDSRLAGALDRQLATADTAAELAEKLIVGELAATDCREEMGRVEHDGDEARADVVRMLSDMLTTPLDREDLYRVSRSLDDVVDGLRDFVREADLLEVEGDDALLPVIVELRESFASLRLAVECLGSDIRESRDLALLAKKQVNAVRRSYQVALSRIYAGEFDVQLLKRCDLLRRLDEVGAHLAGAAEDVADGAMKRGR